MCFHVFKTQGVRVQTFAFCKTTTTALAIWISTWAIPLSRAFLLHLYASCGDYSILLSKRCANIWGENTLLLQNRQESQPTPCQLFLKVSSACMVSFPLLAAPVKSVHKLPRFSTLAPFNKVLFWLDKLLVVTLYAKNIWQILHVKIILFHATSNYFTVYGVLFPYGLAGLSSHFWKWSQTSDGMTSWPTIIYL